MKRKHQNQRLQSSTPGRQNHRHFFYKKLAVVIAVILLVLGYTNLASAAFWTSSYTRGTEITDHFEGDHPDTVRAPAATPTAAGLLPPQDSVASTPLAHLESPSNPEPTSTPVSVASVTNLPTGTLTSTSTISSEEDIKHVVIISVDGMRPDALDLADTPTLDSLIAKGAYSPNAQTIDPSYTLPSHVSMLSGVVPRKHGIIDASPCIGCPLDIGPTLFSVAHEAGLSTAMVFGKQKLNYLNLPNSVDKLFGTDAHDIEVKEQAVEFIEEGLTNILFIHFPDTDRVGHAYGWMSPNYLYAVSYADGLIGEIVAVLKREGYLNSTLLIITADHGGHDFEHGLDCPEDRTIPWLTVGPGVPSGVTLNSHINIYDTAATALHALDLPGPERWDGQPVLEIFEETPQLASGN